MQQPRMTEAQRHDAFVQSLRENTANGKYGPVPTQRRPHNRKGPIMTKLRKLAGWLPAVGAMIFNGCVIGWLHCTKPQLLGSSVPGNVIAVGYTILFLLW